MGNNILFFLLSLLMSCTSPKAQHYQYSINIQEIDCNTNKIVSNIKNSFISYKGGLFEYDYKLKNKTTSNKDGQINYEESYDSVAISFVPENRLIYYQFDLNGNFILFDSVKKKMNDFIKITPDNKQSDPIYKSLGKIREADLVDTILNGGNYKVYNEPNNVKDSIGEIAVQLFFIEDSTLKTPFNISGRYPALFKKFCFAGVSYNVLNINRKLVAIISGIKPVTKEQEELCKLIQEKLVK